MLLVVVAVELVSPSTELAVAAWLELAVAVRVLLVVAVAVRVPVFVAVSKADAVAVAVGVRVSVTVPVSDRDGEAEMDDVADGETVGDGDRDTLRLGERVGVPLQMQKPTPLPAAPQDTRQQRAAHGEVDGETDVDGDTVRVMAAVTDGVAVTAPDTDGDPVALGE